MPNLAHAYIRHARYYYAVVRVADKPWLQGEDSDRGFELFDLQLPVGRWVDWVETAIAAARMLKHRESKGIHLNQLGGAHSNLGNPDETVKCYEQALAIARELGDQHGEGVYLRNLGSAYTDDVGDTQKGLPAANKRLL